MRKKSSLRRAFLLLLLAVPGCGGAIAESEREPPTPAAPLSEPTRLCGGQSPEKPCYPAPEIESWLRDSDLAILGVDPTPGGIQGARVLTLAVDTGRGRVVFRAKWRGHDTANEYNRPRRELAAYHIQKLFLGPDEYVVPPSAAHCFPLASYRVLVDHRADASFAEVDCVFGYLSYWLENTQGLDDANEAGWFDDQNGLYDEDLYEENPIYRRFLGNLNLLTYLIGHADSHWRQFVISTDPSWPAVYSVDNSMSFGVKKNSDLGQHDWSKLKVESLPPRSLERLRSLKEADLEWLLSFEELALENGQLRSVAPTALATPSTAPLRWLSNRHLQIGLTADEMRQLRWRLAVIAGSHPAPEPLTECDRCR